MKLLCKKSSGTEITPGKYYHFETYQDAHAFIWWYYCENDLKSIEWFTTSGNVGNVGLTGPGYWPLCIWEYFYTPQEERKIKLEKLNETAL